MGLAGERQQRRKLERSETKEHGRPLTADEREQQDIAARAQFKGMVHAKALEYRLAVVTIRDEMEALRGDLRALKGKKAEIAALDERLDDFAQRVIGARQFVIDSGMVLLEGIDINPGKPSVIEVVENKLITP